MVNCAIAPAFSLRQSLHHLRQLHWGLHHCLQKPSSSAEINTLDDLMKDGLEILEAEGIILIREEIRRILAKGCLLYPINTS